MKASTDIRSFNPFNIQSDDNSTHTASHTKENNLNILADLYRKNDDEPDFDCEFLSAGIDDYTEEENIIDPDSEDELLDEFNDNQWDANIYDPYLESTYY